MEKAMNERRCTCSWSALASMKEASSCENRSAISSIVQLTSCSFDLEMRKAMLGSCSCRKEQSSRMSYAEPE